MAVTSRLAACIAALCLGSVRYVTSMKCRIENKGFCEGGGRPDPPNRRFLAPGLKSKIQRNYEEQFREEFGAGEVLERSILGRVLAKLGPKTLADRRGASCSAGFTKNQRRGSSLRQFRDEASVFPDGQGPENNISIHFIFVFRKRGSRFSRRFPAAGPPSRAHFR